MTDTNRSRVGIVFIVFLAVILLAFPIFFFVRQNSSNKRTSLAPSPTPRRTVATAGKPVIRTISSTVISYWLYGRIISVEGTDPRGLRVRFVLDGDPFRTQLPIVILIDEGKYKLLTYEDAFGGKSRTEYTQKDVVTPLAGTDTLVELRLPFLRSRVSGSDQKLMTALEAPLHGNWQDLPAGTQIIADSVGIIEK